MEGLLRYSQALDLECNSRWRSYSDKERYSKGQTPRIMLEMISNQLKIVLTCHISYPTLQCLRDHHIQPNPVMLSHLILYYIIHIRPNIISRYPAAKPIAKRIQRRETEERYPLEMFLPKPKPHIPRPHLLTRSLYTLRRRIRSTKVHSDRSLPRALHAHALNIRAAGNPIPHSRKQRLEIGSPEVRARFEFREGILFGAYGV